MYERALSRKVSASAANPTTVQTPWCTPRPLVLILLDSDDGTRSHRWCGCSRASTGRWHTRKARTARALSCTQRTPRTHGLGWQPPPHNDWGSYQDRSWSPVTGGMPRNPIPCPTTTCPPPRRSRHSPIYMVSLQWLSIPSLLKLPHRPGANGSVTPHSHSCYTRASLGWSNRTEDGLPPPRAPRQR